MQFQKGQKEQSEKLCNSVGQPVVMIKFNAWFHRIGADEPKPKMKEMFKHCLLEFKDLRIENAIMIAERKQTIRNSDKQVREFMVEIKMNNQMINFNMESPEADSEKGISRNTAVFLLNGIELEIEIRERHFRLEKDEEAFLKQIRKHMNDQNQLQQLLDNKQGGASESLETKQNNLRGLDDIIPTKKVEFYELNPKLLFSGTINIDQNLKQFYDLNFGAFSEFNIQLDYEYRLIGQGRLVFNEFTKMPRGQITFKIDQQTQFKRDQLTELRDVVFLFTKKIDSVGDVM